MRAIGSLLTLLLTLAIPNLTLAQQFSIAAAADADPQQRTEQAIDTMLFASGYFIASIAEQEPYMTAANRDRFVEAMARELEAAQAEAARTYMAQFEQRFGDALGRARPGILTRVATGLRSAAAPDELAALEQFVLGEETRSLFNRIMQQWIARGGGDESINASDYTPSERAAIDEFIRGPGGRIFEGNAFEALVVAELRTFVPAFEREFFLGLCVAAEQECPAWTRN